MELGQLATERNASSSTADAGKVTQCLKDAAASFVDHGGAIICGDRTKDAAPIHTTSREESFETPSRTGNARGDKGGEEGGGARDRDDTDASGNRRTNKVLAGVTDEWRSRITNQRQCISSLEAFNERCDPSNLVESWEGNQLARYVN
jgi:hypothetical protein